MDALSIARRSAHDGDVAALLDVARSVADAVEEDAKSVAVEAEEAWAEARPLAAMLDEMREFQEENDANFPGEEETSSADDPERSAENLRSLVAFAAPRRVRLVRRVGDDVRVASPRASPVEPLSISDERTLRGGAADGIVGRRSSRLGV